MYDAFEEKGTMFQCLGLGATKDGGCGEDWWHPGCVTGHGAKWYEDGTHEAGVQTSEMTPKKDHKIEETQNGIEETLGVGNGTADSAADEDDTPLPPGFPHEDDFEGFICYKCVEANPWVKRYAGTEGFLAPVFRRSAAPSPETNSNATKETPTASLPNSDAVSKKRKAGDGDEDTASVSESAIKKIKHESSSAPVTLERPAEELSDGNKPSSRSPTYQVCKYETLPLAPTGTFSLFFTPTFRTHLCRCPSCFPLLATHPHLLEEEDIYEPPVSELGDDDDNNSTAGSGSLLDRGEKALSNVDRVRAIEGVMAYNQLKEKLQPFFAEFAESGRAIGAEDIRRHFAKMRGDEEEVREGASAGGDGEGDGGHRREQRGF